MFVRFRERRNDTRQPWHIAAKIACRHPERCAKRKGQRLGPGFRAGKGCPLRPRCRWRIGLDEGVNLVPYRLLASLVANRRIDGKIRQEHIADLGAIDGYYLPCFFRGIEARIADAICDEQWFIASIAMRLAFWGELDARLTRLSNRIVADEADMVRAMVNARIPKPTDEEFEKMEMTGWQRLLDAWQGFVDDDQKQIAGYEESIAEARERIARTQPVVGALKDQLKALSGNFTAIQASVDLRQDMDMLMLRILADRAFGRRSL